ncbi:MAG: VOC family protein [Pseudomonadota bacterium]
MKLGAFSVSLAVKDIHQSVAFYEKLGFSAYHGDVADGWIILKNGDHIIGLFQGMFEKNILTFNPGWDQDAKPLDAFVDVREIQKSLRDAGVEIAQSVDEDGQGPGRTMVIDPDGNPVLIDQHV